MQNIKLLTDILINNSNNYGQRPALTMKLGYRTISFNYKELYLKSRQVALWFNENDIKKGDRIIIMAPNSPYWVIVFWACLLEGIIIVPLNIQSNSTIIDLIIKETEPKLFVGKNIELKNIKVISPEDLVLAAQDYDVKNYNKPAVKQEDIIEIMYTSGTTGDPKGVILTHLNLITNINGLDNIFPRFKKDNVFLSILPLSHIFEQTVGLFITSHLHSHIIFAHKPSAIIDLIKEFKIKSMIAVPEFLQVVIGKIKIGVEKKGLGWVLELLKKAQEKGVSNKILRILSWVIRRSIGSSLKTVISGGAALDRKTELAWQSLAINVLEGYGLTETSPIIAYNNFSEKKSGSVGKPLTNLAVKIENGEILVKGKSIFKGYYKNNLATEIAFDQEGWFKTGDLGEIDTDGFLHIKGRKKYMILSSSGQNVFPEDIESVIKEQSNIKDVAVIGVERNNNTIIYALILPEKDKKIDILEIIKKANSNLASYQQIMEYSIWPEEDFPRTATRKIKKNELLDYILNKNQIKQNSIISNNKLFLIIASICHCQVQEINESDTIGSLHLDSLKKAELTARIIDEYNIEFTEQKLKNDLSIKELEELIKKSPVFKQVKIFKKWMQWPIIVFFRFILIEIICLLARLFIKLKVKNIKNLEITEPSLIMPNHVSYMDPLLIIMALPRRLRTKIACAAAQDALFEKFWIISHLSEFLFYAFPISRGTESNIEEAFSKMGKLLDNGYSILFFPEGGVSKTEDILMPLKQGAGLAAITLNAPVIPINISGAQAIQPYDKIAITKSGIVELNIGNKIKFSHTDSVSEVTKQIYDKLLALK